MKDPVSAFEYPDEWVNACKSPELLDCVRKGLCVLTSSGTVLRRGYSTGTTAAAACKAAVISLKRDVDAVDIRLPCGIPVNIPVTACDGRASALKYPGDYKADVTGGVKIIATARPLSKGVVIDASTGIGRYTRDLPGHPAGTPAISKSAYGYIWKAMMEGVAETGLQGVQVELSIPDGIEIAEKTLNSRLGIIGGISVVGTTGLVEPWDDHVDESIIARVGKADRVVITTGRTGLRYSRLLFPDHEAVLVGTRIAQALQHARGEVVVCGLPALILKFMDPEILERTGFKTIGDMSMSKEYPSIVMDCLCAFKKNNPGVRVVLVNSDGKVIGDSE